MDEAACQEYCRQRHRVAAGSAVERADQYYRQLARGVLRRRGAQCPCRDHGSGRSQADARTRNSKRKLGLARRERRGCTLKSTRSAP